MSIMDSKKDRRLEYFLKIKYRISALFFPGRSYVYPKKNYCYHNLSFSQEGEDMILKRYFEHKLNGFYVDVGAHHPQRFSNTYLFYLMGWQGINIDPMPGSMNLFNILRSRDTNLEIGISKAEQKLTYYIFAEAALNTCSKKLAEQHKIPFIATKEITTYPLSDVLDRYLPPDKSIDFLTIDIEGLDFEVLESNNWTKYNPSIILVEDLQAQSIEKALGSNTTHFLEAQNYSMIAKTRNTLFFKRNA